MQMESRMRVEPGLDVGGLVGGVVVQVTWMARPLGTSRSMVRRNLRNSW
jgi:hypothetical protein